MKQTMLLYSDIRLPGTPLVVRRASYVFAGNYKLKERLWYEVARFMLVTREFTRAHCAAQRSALRVQSLLYYPCNFDSWFC